MVLVDNIKVKVNYHIYYPLIVPDPIHSVHTKKKDPVRRTMHYNGRKFHKYLPIVMWRANLKIR